jgi:purine nucleosidase/pyrimidine-specific ribonucleoside hydrolase
MGGEIMSLKRLSIFTLLFVLILASCQSGSISTATPTSLPTTVAAADNQPSSPSPTISPTKRPTITPRAADQPLHVIFDDDGSPDGTTALLYLLSHQGVSLTSASISYGEAYPDIYIQHIARILDDFGIQGIPLGAGQSAPLAGNNAFPEGVRQGANNFWGLPLPNADKTYPVLNAAELLVSAIQQYPAPVTVFISGPGTNLAQALRLDPNIKRNIAAVYIMGGAVYASGNLHDFLPEKENTVAEWNIYADPQAAKEIFESGLNIFLVPLDATNQVTIGKENTSQWRKGSQVAGFAADIYDMLLNNWRVDQAAIWDLMTAAIMVNPDLCEFQPLPLRVITDAGKTNGQTAVVQDGQPNIQVCLKPDADQIRQTLDRVFSSGWIPSVVSVEPAATDTPEVVMAPSITPERLLFRDDFNVVLQPGWTWENENSQRWTITADGWLQILGEDNALLYGQLQSNLVWRAIPSGDFAITVHLIAEPITNFQQATIYLYENLENYIAINRGFCGFCLTGGSGIYMEYKIDGQFGSYKMDFQEADVYLKLVSEEHTISGYYAKAPDQWERLGRFGNYFTFKKVGLGVTNSDMEGDDAADLTGLFDYFEITRP